MTLAEQCQTIWPCGWTSDWTTEQGTPTATAVVLGHEVVVQEVSGVFNAYLQNVRTASATLRGALELLHKQLTALPPIPDLVEVPVHQQAEEILAAQGWKKCLIKNWWGSEPFWVALCPERVDLWYRGHCVKTIVLVQGTVREQLKELLTFPQWKDTP